MALERIHEKWLRWLGLPILLLLSNLLYIKEYKYNIWLYLGWSALGMVYIRIVWAALDWWRLWGQQRYTDIRQTVKRVGVLFLGYCLITATAQLIFLLVSHYTQTAPVPVTQPVIITHLSIGLLGVIVFGTAYEVFYYLHQYRLAVEEAEVIQTANLQSQFDNLKNQVNPHFLFNSLTSLSALISINKKSANEFLDELASVYRYLLQSKEVKWVSLQAEIRFIQSLFYILRVRYGEAIQLNLAVSPDLLEASLPPFSLQILVENAIRHNSILPECPLTISIHTRDSAEATYGEPAIVVTNTIQHKSLRVDNRPGGLLHLADRFALLALPYPIIEDDGQHFVVQLPLLIKHSTVS